jgi:hypothetical protein
MHAAMPAHKPCSCLYDVGPFGGGSLLVAARAIFQSIIFFYSPPARGLSLRQRLSRFFHYTHNEHYHQRIRRTRVCQR